MPTNPKEDADKNREQDQEEHDRGQKDGSEMNMIGRAAHGLKGPDETPYDKGVTNGLKNQSFF